MSKHERLVRRIKLPKGFDLEATRLANPAWRVTASGSAYPRYRTLSGDLDVVYTMMRPSSPYGRTMFAVVHGGAANLGEFRGDTLLISARKRRLTAISAGLVSSPKNK